MGYHEILEIAKEIKMGAIDQPLPLIQAFFNALRGQQCWSVTAGPGTGSMVSISFGRHILRSRPIRNPTLSPDQCKFDGEFKIFIQETEWALKKNGDVICTNESGNDANGPMVTGLHQLVGKLVTSFVLIGETYDFELVFEGGYCLEVSCTTSSEALLHNYSLFDFTTVRLIIE